VRSASQASHKEVGKPLVKPNIMRLGIVAICAICLFISIFPNIAEATATNVTTLRCTGFGNNWLLFNGNVTPVSNITRVGFTYGITTAYGANADLTYTNYTATTGYYQYVSGLNQATTYHYEANAYNNGWYYGTDWRFSTANNGGLMEWEGNVQSINTTENVYGANWGMESFYTTNVTAHTISSVDIWLSRGGETTFNGVTSIGFPGDVTVTVQRAGTGGYPYGTILSSGTLSGQYTGNIPPYTANQTTRYNIPLTPEVPLLANTNYCITVKALQGDSNNYIKLGVANNSTATNNLGYFTNITSTWVSTASNYNFDLWGHPCLQVDNAKVFTSYQTAGDWLIVFYYDNIYPPYYPASVAKQTFVYQLVDQYNTVLAQQPCQQWGINPGSLYLGASTVAPLQWGGYYRVRLIDLYDSTVYMEYPLQPSDWLGSSTSSWTGTDLSLLDSWSISTAQQISQYTGVALTTPVAGKGTVLNATGSAMFENGIPMLAETRPNIFQVSSTTPTYTQGQFPQLMRQKLTVPLMLGPDATAAMTSVGNLFGVDARTVGLGFLLLISLFLAGWCFQPGHTIAAITMSGCLFILDMGLVSGIIDPLIGGLLLAIIAIVGVYFIWWRGG